MDEYPTPGLFGSTTWTTGSPLGDVVVLAVLAAAVVVGVAVWWDNVGSQRWDHWRANRADERARRRRLRRAKRRARREKREYKGLGYFDPDDTRKLGTDTVVETPPAKSMGQMTSEALAHGRLVNPISQTPIRREDVEGPDFLRANRQLAAVSEAATAFPCECAMTEASQIHCPRHGENPERDEVIASYRGFVDQVWEGDTEDPERRSRWWTWGVIDTRDQKHLHCALCEDRMVGRNDFVDRDDCDTLAQALEEACRQVINVRSWVLETIFATGDEPTESDRRQRHRDRVYGTDTIHPPRAQEVR